MRAQGICLCALFVGTGVSVRAADIILTPGALGSRTVGVPDLQAGAGSDFRSPLETDVLLATIAINNTGGSSWSVSVGHGGDESGWPPGVSIAVKRSSGVDEIGLSEGETYQTLTGDLRPFFSGTGDYPSIQILLRLDGASVHTTPGLYNLTIRYAVEAPSP